MANNLISRPRSKKADMPAIKAFAAVSNDYNPLHVDPAFAAKTSYGSVIAHGPMSTGLLLSSIADALSPEAIRGATLTLKFARPVRENDTVTTASTEPAPGQPHRVWVENQNGEIVIEGSLVLKVPGA